MGHTKRPFTLFLLFLGFLSKSKQRLVFVLGPFRVGDDGNLISIGLWAGRGAPQHVKTFSVDHVAASFSQVLSNNAEDGFVCFKECN